MSLLGKLLQPITNPITGNYELVHHTSPQVECYKALNKLRLDPFKKKAYDSRHTQLMEYVKFRCQDLWKAAQQLNPSFKDQDLNVQFIDDPIGSCTCGGNIIYISKKDLDEFQSAPKRLDMICTTAAHEIAHCILRHIPTRTSREFTIRKVAPCLSLLLLNLVYIKFLRTNPLINPSIISKISILTLLFVSTLKPMYTYWATKVAPFVRQQETEADATASLIIAKYNQTCHATNTNSPLAQPLMWKLRSLNWFDSADSITQENAHPQSMVRADMSLRAALILDKNPDVLTDKEKRKAYFQELAQARSANNPEFMQQWNISQGEPESKVNLIAVDITSYCGGTHREEEGERSIDIGQPILTRYCQYQGEPVFLEDRR